MLRKCQRVLRLIEADLAAAWKSDVSDRPPSGLLQFRTVHAFFRECPNLGLDIVTQKIEFVTVRLSGRMHGHFRRRHRENQPSVTGIHRRQPEHVPEEGSIRLRIFAGDDDMRAKDHARFLSLPRSC